MPLRDAEDELPLVHSSEAGATRGRRRRRALRSDAEESCCCQLCSSLFHLLATALLCGVLWIMVAFAALRYAEVDVLDLLALRQQPEGGYEAQALQLASPLPPSSVVERQSLDLPAVSPLPSPPPVTSPLPSPLTLPVETAPSFQPPPPLVQQLLPSPPPLLIPHSTAPASPPPPPQQQQQQQQQQPLPPPEQQQQQQQQPASVLSVPIDDEPFEFVQASGTQLTVGGSPYSFTGLNMWQAVWVAHSNPERLRRELDTLHASGIRVLRIVAASEGEADAPLQVSPTLQPTPGVFDEALAAALDLVLHEMRSRRMRAILTINNQWSWSGGFATYLVWARGGSWRDIPYPSSHLDGYWSARPAESRPKIQDADWHTYQVWAGAFYSTPKAVALAEATVAFLLTRVNSLSGVRYADDATILAYELCNEPRAVANGETDRRATRDSYLRWVKRTSSLIKQLSPRHLVTVGSEGTTPFEEYANNAFTATHELRDVDFVTIHTWPQNWGWGDASGAAPFRSALTHSLAYLADHAARAAAISSGNGQVGKPLVMSEFGLARDGQSADADDPAMHRDAFYSAMLRAAAEHGISGVMPWAW